jgi:hypothetical protein
MSVFKQVFVVLLGLLGLALLVSFVLPSSWEVSREMHVSVWPREVHAVAGDLETWKTWSPWSTAADPSAKFELSAETSEVGSTLSWTGRELGTGKLIITSIDRDKGIEFELRLRGGKEIVRGALGYQEIVTGATIVSLRVRGDVGGNPIGRYMAIARGYTMGPSIVEAIARLKRTAERL